MTATDHSEDRTVDDAASSDVAASKNAKASPTLAPGVKKSPVGIALFSTLLLLWIGWLVYLAIRLNF